MMAAPFLLSTRPEFSITEQSEDEIILDHPFGRLKLSNLSDGLRTAVLRLFQGGASEDDLATIVFEEDGAQTLSRFYYFLAEFKRRLMLCYCVATDAGPLATLVPASFNFEFSPETPPP